jgi:hypothetical protein
MRDETMKLLNAVSAERRLELRSYHRALTAHLFEQAGRGLASDVVKSFRDGRASLLLRAAVAPTGRGDFPVQRIVDIYRSLAPSSAAMALFERSMHLDLSGIDQIYLPNVTNPASAPAIFVAEGAPARVTQMVFNKTTLGPACKTLVIAAVSNELEAATPQTASQVIARVLSDRTNVGIDKVAFGTAAGSATQPAGLLNGATGVTATAPSATVMLTEAAASDVGNLLGAIGAAGINPTGAVLVGGPATIGRLMGLLGDLDIDALMTLGLSDKTLAAIAPNAVASGYQGAPQIEIGRDATLHFEDTTPLELVSSPGTVAAPARSLYQDYQLAIKVRGNAAWCVLPGGVATITGVCDGKFHGRSARRHPARGPLQHPRAACLQPQRRRGQLGPLARGPADGGGGCTDRDRGLPRSGRSRRAKPVERTHAAGARRAGARRAGAARCRRGTARGRAEKMSGPRPPF